jgi:hypothetical protein
LEFSRSSRVTIGGTAFSAYKVPLSQYPGASGSFSATAAEDAKLKANFDLKSEQYKLLHGHDLDTGDLIPGTYLSYYAKYNKDKTEGQLGINGDLGGIVYAYQGTAGEESGCDAGKLT